MKRTQSLVVLCAVILAGCAADPLDTTGDQPEALAPVLVPVDVVSLADDLPGVAVSTTAWDLGVVDLDDGAAAPLRGVAALPQVSNGQPAPVVVVLHGSHAICLRDPAPYGSWPCPPGTEVPNEEGLLWLLEAIAARGFVALAPAVNVQHTFGSGEPMAGMRTIDVVTRTLKALDDGELPIPPQRADTSRLVVVGHSVGGQDANLLARGHGGFNRTVIGQILLQPALNADEARVLADIPSVVVVSECDGDVRLTGGIYVSERLSGGRVSPIALVMLEGGSHNATNTLLEVDAFPIEAPTCDALTAARAETPDAWDNEAVNERARLAQMVPSFVTAVTAASVVVGSEDRASQTSWATQVFTEPVVPQGVHLVVIPAGAATPLLPGEGDRALDGLTAGDDVGLLWCPSGYYTSFVFPDKEDCHRPELTMMVGQAATVAVTWDRLGTLFTLPVTAQKGDILRLRFFLDLADTRFGDEPLEVQMSAQDGSGVRVTVPLPPVLRFENPPFELAGAFLPWYTVRAVVMEDLEEITVSVLGPAAGSLQIVTLGID